MRDARDELLEKIRLDPIVKPTPRSSDERKE
jgi:hypothetical protein